MHDAASLLAPRVRGRSHRRSNGWSAMKRGQARLTSRDVPRDRMRYRSRCRSSSWRRRTIMEEFIRRPAAACAIGAVGPHPARRIQTGAGVHRAMFIGLLHISRTAVVIFGCQLPAYWSSVAWEPSLPVASSMDLSMLSRITLRLFLISFLFLVRMR